MKNIILGFVLLGSVFLAGCAQVGPDAASADEANAKIKNMSLEDKFNMLKTAPLSESQKETSIKGWNASEEEKAKFIERLKSEGRGAEAPGNAPASKGPGPETPAAGN